MWRKEGSRMMPFATAAVACIIFLAFSGSHQVQVVTLTSATIGKKHLYNGTDFLDRPSRSPHVAVTRDLVTSEKRASQRKARTATAPFPFSRYSFPMSVPNSASLVNTEQTQSKRSPVNLIPYHQSSQQVDCTQIEEYHAHYIGNGVHFHHTHPITVSVSHSASSLLS